MNKKRSLKQSAFALFVAIGCLVIYFIINTLLAKIHLSLVSFALGIPPLIALIVIYRNIFLFNIPEIIINEKEIRYFNITWYVTYQWDKIGKILLDEDAKGIQVIGLNGRPLNRIGIKTYNDEDGKRILELINKYKGYTIVLKKNNS